MRSILRILFALLAGAILISHSEMTAHAQKQKAPPPKKEIAAPAPPEAFLKSDAWKDVPATPLQPGEIDRLLDKELQGAKLTPAPRTTDEQFLRRVRLDLTGQLPAPREIEQFLADKDPAKRARVIDRLLETDEYARHWARYWRYVVTAVEAPFGEPLAPQFEDWLCAQFKQNRSWGEIVRAIMTADGQLKKGEDSKNGAVFFLGRHSGPDGNIARTAETARVFLGIQIQCAQCHNDRRTKIWKQVQFHELAGFFARMTVGGSAGSLIKVMNKKFGEHEMPSKDPGLVYITYPRFLDGKAPSAKADDAERRQALADFLTSPDNYWFSAAFVNRLWSELLGQAFYERVDDLSPRADVVFPSVTARLAASFRGSGYDIKALIRAIASSDAYQRQVRVGASADQHLKFAAVYPARLRADVLWDVLGRVLVQMPVTNPFVLKAFQTEFDFDPSLKADEVVGSIPQALWLLNGTILNDRIKVQDVRMPGPGKAAKMPAKGSGEPTLLKQILTRHADDPGALRELYLHTLTRRPTDRELETCLQYIRESGSRNEGFEDIFKALLNTAEFQRKR